ncbi:MAG: NADH-quinone oxidoreductase subunit C [Nitrososphaerales archaeon]
MPEPAKTESPSPELLLAQFLAPLGDKAKIVISRENRLKIIVKREDLLEVAKFARDQMHFDHSTNVTGTDFPKDNELEITYHLGSLDGEGLRGVMLALACRVPKSDPTLSSLIELYPSVNYHERETAEMIGAVFTGHPNLGRFMLPEDWNDIPPMLKAYRLPGRLESE